MHNKVLQEFIEKVSQLAIKRCGKRFQKEMASHRAEREKILMKNWREVPPDYLESYEETEMFREVDFDTIIVSAASYLKPDNYATFLYEVAEISIVHGELEKAQRLLEKIIVRFSKWSEKLLNAKAHQRLGDLAFYRNNWNRTLTAYRKGLRLYTELENARGIMEVKNSMGATMVEQGRSTKGEKLLQEARKMALSNKYIQLLVKVDINLGNFYNMIGSWESAMDCYGEALSALGRKQEDDMRARIYIDMAITLKEQGKYSSALKQLNKSIEFSSHSNNMYLTGLSYLEKAEVSCLMSEFPEGTALATTAFQIFSDMGDRLSVAAVYKVLGMINRDSERFDLALQYFKNSVRINEENDGNALHIGNAHFELAKLHVDMGDSSKATKRFNSSIKLFKQVGVKPKIAQVKLALAGLR